jgi:hypothetical protein
MHALAWNTRVSCLYGGLPEIGLSWPSQRPSSGKLIGRGALRTAVVSPPILGGCSRSDVSNGRGCVKTRNTRRVGSAACDQTNNFL